MVDKTKHDIEMSRIDASVKYYSYEEALDLTGKYVFLILIIFRRKLREFSV